MNTLFIVQLRCRIHHVASKPKLSALVSAMVHAGDTSSGGGHRRRSVNCVSESAEYLERQVPTHNKKNKRVSSIHGDLSICITTNDRRAHACVGAWRIGGGKNIRGANVGFDAQRFDPLGIKHLGRQLGGWQRNGLHGRQRAKHFDRQGGVQGLVIDRLDKLIDRSIDRSIYR
jgi:hypothetical protein